MRTRPRRKKPEEILDHGVGLLVVSISRYLTVDLKGSWADAGLGKFCLCLCSFSLLRNPRGGR